VVFFVFLFLSIFFTFAFVELFRTISSVWTDLVALDGVKAAYTGRDKTNISEKIEKKLKKIYATYTMPNVTPPASPAAPAARTFPFPEDSISW
jgi:hypothetical protein